MLWQCCSQYASKFGKLSSGHRTEKAQFPFQSQRKAMPRNAQTTTQLYSSHILARSVQFSHSVMSDFLWPHELQHARPPCPSPSPGVHSDSCPLSPWCHPAISSSVVPFSSCPQSLPASESFPMSLHFAWGGQSTGVSALASFLPKNTQGWSPSEWTGWISLQSKGLSSLLQHHSSKASILRRSAFFTVQLSHPYRTTGKTRALTRWTFVGKVMSLLLSMLSKLVITFLPRSKRLLVSWLQSPSAVTLVVGHSKSHERHSWTGGTSSDFLLVRAVHREGNYLLWINSVSCCYFFLSWILFPRNTISWWISGLLLLTRLGVSFSVPVQKCLSRVWTTPYVQCCCFFVKRIQCSWDPCIALS